MSVRVNFNVVKPEDLEAYKRQQQTTLKNSNEIPNQVHAHAAPQNGKRRESGSAQTGNSTSPPPNTNQTVGSAQNRHAQRQTQPESPKLYPEQKSAIDEPASANEGLPNQLQYEDAPKASLHINDLGPIRSKLSLLLKQRLAHEIFIRLVIKTLNSQDFVLGTIFAYSNEAGDWLLDESSRTGIPPSLGTFEQKYFRLFDSAAKGKVVQVDTYGQHLLFVVPLQSSQNQPGTLAITFAAENIEDATLLSEFVKDLFERDFRERQLHENRWKLNSLAAILDLIEKVESADSFDSACDVVTNETANFLNASQVGLAIKSMGNCRLKSLSGEAEFNRKSELIQLIETAVLESSIQDRICHYPDDGSFLANSNRPSSQQRLLAHKQLTSLTQHEVTISVPIHHGNQIIAVLILLGTRSELDSQRVEKFLRILGERLGSTLEVAKRADRGLPGKITKAFRKWFCKYQTYLALALLSIVGYALFHPLEYRLRENCKLEAFDQRNAVIPFEGIVEKVFVKPGDTVTKGQILAKMQTRPIELELAALHAQLQTQREQRKINLLKDQISESIVSEYSAQAISADIERLNLQLKTATVVAPIDGIVLQSPRPNPTGDSFQLGETLFEVGTLDQLSVEITIPANEMAHVTIGQPLRISINGFPEFELDTSIEKIRPQSELRDSKNVFVAEVLMQNDNDRFRPGMRGKCQISCEEKSLGWILFHKPWQQIRSRLQW